MIMTSALLYEEYISYPAASFDYVGNDRIGDSTVSLNVMADQDSHPQT